MKFCVLNAVVLVSLMRASSQAAAIILPGPTIPAIASSSYNADYVVTNLYDGTNLSFGDNTGATLGNAWAAGNVSTANGSKGNDINPVVVYNYGSSIAAQGIAFSQRDNPSTAINIWFTNTPYTPSPNTDPALTLGLPSATVSLLPIQAGQNLFALTEYDFSQSLSGQYIVFQLINQDQTAGGADNPGGYELRLIQTPEPASIALVGLTSFGLLARRRRNV